MSFNLRQADAGDLDAVLDLLAQAATWLRAQGIDQWPVGGFPPARIEPLIEAEVVYVLEPMSGADMRPAATVSLDDGADPEFWRLEDRPESALYVHKLAVDRGFSGQGLGEALLDWAGVRVLENGRIWLRLDCSKRNLRLQRYYLRQKFDHVRTVDLAHRASGALFQRGGWIRTGGQAVRIRDLTESAAGLVS